MTTGKKITISIFAFLLGIILVSTIIGEAKKDKSLLYLNNTNVNDYFSFTYRIEGLTWNAGNATVYYTISSKDPSYAEKEKSSDSITVTIKLWTARAKKMDSSAVKISSAKITLYKNNNYNSSGSISMESQGTYYTIALSNAEGQLEKLTN